jgi:hypothetical protein
MEQSNSFTCEQCKGVFIKGQTDEESMEEANKAFTPEELADTVVVCDECWKLLLEAIPELKSRYGKG